MPLKAYRTQEFDEGNHAIESFLQEEFDGHQEEWDALRRCAVEIIEDGLRGLGIRARVTSRVKSVQSLKKKLHQRNLQKPYVDRYSIFADQLDFVGIRIILFFPSQKSEVVDMLKRLFEYRSIRSFHRDWKPRKWQVYDKIHGEYAADHVWLRINRDAKPLVGAPMPGKYIGQPFEVQLRSLLMDVWSSMSHDLEYKSLQGTLSASEHSLLDMLKGSTEKGDAEINSLRQSETSPPHEAGDKTLPFPGVFDEMFEQHPLRDRPHEEHQDEVELLTRALREAALTAPPQVEECLIECAEQLTSLRGLHLDRLEMDRKPLCLDEVQKILIDHTPQNVISEVPMGNSELLLSMLQRMDADTPCKLRSFLLNRNVRGRIDEDLKSWSRHDQLLLPTISLYVLKRILEELFREDMITIPDQSQFYYYTKNLISAAENAWVHSNSADSSDNFLSHSLSQTLIWVHHAVDGAEEASRCTLESWQVEKCARIWAAFVWVRKCRPTLSGFRIPLPSPLLLIYRSSWRGCHCRGGTFCFTCGFIDLVAELSYLDLLPSPHEFVDKNSCSTCLHSEIQHHEQTPDAQSESISPVVLPRNQCLFKFVRRLQLINPESWNRGISKFFSGQGRATEPHWSDEIDDSVYSAVRISAWLAEIGEDGLLQEYLDPEWNPSETTRSGITKMVKLTILAKNLNNEEMKRFTSSVQYTALKEPGRSERDGGNSILERIAAWLADIGEHDLLQEYLDPSRDLARSARGFRMMQKLSKLAIQYSNDEVKEFTSSMRMPAPKEPRAPLKDKNIGS